MLINLDLKAIEWVVALYLSQDHVGMQEWLDVLSGKINDIHEINQRRFKLSDRVVAKTFLFRVIYGGTIFHTDPDFAHVSKSRKFWDKVIEEFYSKYQGLHQWHIRLVQTATTTGQIQIPSGRVYFFSPIHGQWPRTQILNYPVQGLAADIMALVRVALWRRIHKADLGEKALLVSSIHDSITYDVVNDETIIQQVGKIMDRVVTETPHNFERLFKVPFNLPLKVEIEVGMCKGAMKRYDPVECSQTAPDAL